MNTISAESIFDALSQASRWLESRIDLSEWD